LARPGEAKVGVTERAEWILAPLASRRLVVLIRRPSFADITAIGDAAFEIFLLSEPAAFGAARRRIADDARRIGFGSQRRTFPRDLGGDGRCVLRLR
jgi:hypothetical protein